MREKEDRKNKEKEKKEVDMTGDGKPEAAVN